MKAVVLAGGRGSRLFPLTQTRPKPLSRVLDRPILDYTLKALSDLGIREVALTTHYLSEQIRLSYKTNFLDLHLHYFEESSPLGTAGAVKAAQEFLDEDFLTLSGDALFDFDLSRARDAFYEKRAKVLLVLSRQSQPLEYGVVRTDADGKISAFREKPDWQHVFSDTVNTGIYFCSRELLDEIPEDTPFDFSHDLFPKLFAKQTPIYGEVLDGYWCDVGSPGALYHCNLDALQGRCALNLAPDGSFVGSGREKSFISNGARLLPGAHVSASVIGAGCEIRGGAVVRASVLGAGTIVGAEAKIDTAFLADGVNCEANSEIRGGSVLGEGCVLRSGAHTREGGLYAAKTVIETVSGAFFEPGNVFENGVRALTGTPKEALQLCSALGESSAAAFDRPVIAASARSTADSALADALCSARAFAGAATIRATLPTLECARFAARTLQTPLFYTQYHTLARRASVTLIDEDGLCPAESVQKSFSKAGGAQSAPSPGPVLTLPDAVLDAYRFYLSSLLPRFDGETIRIFPNAAGRLFADALEQSGAQALFAKSADGVFFDLQENGENAILILRRTDLCDADRMRACLLRREVMRGKRYFALPAPLPGAVEDYLAALGAVISYPTLGWSDEKARLERAECAKNAYLFDPAALCASFLDYWHALSVDFSPESLQKALKAIPNYIVQRQDFEFPKEQTAQFAAAAWELSEESPAGLRLKTEKGSVRFHLKPGRIRLFAESADPETARELCDFSIRALENRTHTP